MQAMPPIPGVASGRIVSAGAAFVIGAGLALYQLTSLVLAPVSSRQLDLSLTIPAVEAQDLSERMIGNVKIVVGTLAPAPKTPSHPQSLRIPPRLRGRVRAGGRSQAPRKSPSTTDYHDPDERSPGLARRR
jgi:hypothetical protein